MAKNQQPDGPLTRTDLKQRITKEAFREQKKVLTLQLGALQRKLVEQGRPLILVFEGWDAAGKGTLINALIQPLDPRGFQVVSTLAPNEEEALRPFLWRFWKNTPAAGRIAIFDRSWYRRLLNDRIEKRLHKRDRPAAREDVLHFERQLADSGCIILKFFLHISKAEQAKRFRKIRSNPAMRWRVSAEDEQRHALYKQYFAAAEEMILETDRPHAPWSVLSAHDRRYATVQLLDQVVSALTDRLAEAGAQPAAPLALPPSTGLLEAVDLSASVSRAAYDKQLKPKQKHLRDLEHELYARRIPLVILYEGWDAAGKGGNIRRLTQRLDPRGYEVVPIAAPSPVEKRHHYLWRFWNAIPKAGHITIFDRTWYGRVLVERVEGFCSEHEWHRAYQEINEMEAHLVHFGAILVKIWLHISPDEQLRRFREREALEHKKWKITDEDWRNREKWDAYRAAVEDMLQQTDTTLAPWTVVPSDCKLHARLHVIDRVTEAIESRLA